MPIFKGSLPLPIKKGLKFQVPWQEAGMPSKWKAFKWTKSRKSPVIPTTQEILDNPYLNPKEIDFYNASNMVSNSPKKLKYTWIGHSTVLISINEFNILTDPLFNDKIGPWFVRVLSSFKDCSYKSFRALEISQLPFIDAVIISHDHFDHFDAPSLFRMRETFKENVHFFTPLGYKRLLNYNAITKVTEFNWWDEILLDIESGGIELSKNIAQPIKDENVISFTLTPAQHWCCRKVFDLNWKLWGSWVFRTKNFKAAFFGDTGYCDALKLIGDTYGPFDLSMIPIGAYEPRDMMKNEHLNVEEAIQLHNDLRSKRSIGIHWGGFHFSDEPFFDPPNKLLELGKTLIQDKSTEFTPVRIGETYTIDL